MLSWVLLVLSFWCGWRGEVPSSEPQFPHLRSGLQDHVVSPGRHAWFSVSLGELPGQKLGPPVFLFRPHHPLPQPQPQPGPTLCKEKVRTQNVASSMVSSSVTWMKPYVSVPRLGQY